MTKPQEIITPSLPEFVAEIVKLATQGYTMHLEPQMAGWQYYCEMIKEGEPNAVVAATTTEAPKHQRGPKPKKNVEA